MHASCDMADPEDLDEDGDDALCEAVDPAKLGNSLFEDNRVVGTRTPPGTVA